MSKVIEKVIHNQTSAFLNSRNLLYNYQSGFHKNSSMVYCLSFLNDKILKGFNQGLMTGMILINLNEFEWLNWLNDILQQKLYIIGFSKHSVNWFWSCVKYRTFLVNLGNAFFNLHVCLIVYRRDLFLALYYV